MNLKERRFIHEVLRYYKVHGRHDLPWRKTKNPYRILVSEVMLQQTQVERVIPKYKEFLNQFPTCKSLAGSSLADVLKAWQGLGYNRRAKMLHQATQTILSDHKGRFPHSYEDLLSLPGVGRYTAGAIMAFAYNTPVPIIETNIRTVYLRYFFKNIQHVTDIDILQVVERTLPKKDVRIWYAALMDYGSYLKEQSGNENIRSANYKRQSEFQNSDRQVRGQLIRILATQPSGLSMSSLRKQVSGNESSERFKSQLKKLINEQLVEQEGDTVRLPT